MTDQFAKLLNDVNSLRWALAITLVVLIFVLYKYTPMFDCIKEHIDPSCKKKSVDMF